MMTLDRFDPSEWSDAVLFHVAPPRARAKPKTKRQHSWKIGFAVAGVAAGLTLSGLAMPSAAKADPIVPGHQARPAPPPDPADPDIVPHGYWSSVAKYLAALPARELDDEIEIPDPLD